MQVLYKGKELKDVKGSTHRYINVLAKALKGHKSPHTLAIYPSTTLRDVFTFEIVRERVSLKYRVAPPNVYLEVYRTPLRSTDIPIQEDILLHRQQYPIEVFELLDSNCRQTRRLCDIVTELLINHGVSRESATAQVRMCKGPAYERSGAIA